LTADSGAQHVAHREDADVQTLKDLVAGDRLALGRLYDRHAPLLMGLGVRILKNRSEAEDVLHDVFMEVWKRAASYDAQRGSVRAWLVVRMRSRCLDKIRSAGRARAVSLSAPEGQRAQDERHHPPPAAPRLNTEEAALKGALDELSDDLKATVEAVYFQGMALKSAAEKLGVPVGTVKSRLSAARARIRKILVEGGIT
jgi:RNA polymerase sigma-70 factor (ECF subfamily)